MKAEQILEALHTAALHFEKLGDGASVGIGRDIYFLVNKSEALFIVHFPQEVERRYSTLLLRQEKESEAWQLLLCDIEKALNP